jgi:hypothetical protein
VLVIPQLTCNAGKITRHGALSIAELSPLHHHASDVVFANELGRLQFRLLLVRHGSQPPMLLCPMLKV